MLRLTIAAVVATLATTFPAPASALRLEAESSGMVWNAVAVDHGRVFVAGPRWSGSTGPAVGVLDRGKVRPFPDSRWNSWKPGVDPATAFVNVNAVHLDGRGGLWAVDTGSPEFGGAPLPGGAKLVRIDLLTTRVTRVYPFPSDIATPRSYVDDVRFNGSTAYLTDGGQAGLIVLDLHTGQARRVLDGDPSTTAPDNRPIVVDGTVVRGPDGSPLKVNADPFELSPDHRWLYYGPLEGPWSRISTALLDDPTVPAATLAAHVQPWADLPPTGGTAIDRAGNLYFSDLAHNSVNRRAPDGTVTTVVQDPRLHWTDALFLTPDNRLWLPVPQLDRAPAFNGGTSHIQFPVQLFSFPLAHGKTFD
ncbi:L-dopachrome tautomerase-related protein [Kutzneria sp. NPDC052558]|uniref:L-dopachrome tautomerase-related protein n=1 Tax=Kutzneria sp. NPDC052558 TaxID=3364121 RepID=UPI0037C8161B